MPVGFEFAVRIPRQLADEILGGRLEGVGPFAERLGELGGKLGPLHLLAGGVAARGPALAERLDAFLDRLARLSGPRALCAVEILGPVPNELRQVLHAHGAALVLADRPNGPDPDLLLRGPAVGSFDYVRLVGDPVKTAHLAPEGGRLVLDQGWRIALWAEGLAARPARRRIYVAATDGYAGFAPGVLEEFERRFRRAVGGGEDPARPASPAS